MDVAVIGDEITPGHPNELTDKTLIGHQTVCCGRKPHYHPLLQMAKWVKSNLRHRGQHLMNKAKPPLNGNQKLRRVEMETETL